MAVTTEDRPIVNNDPCHWPAAEAVERTVQTARRAVADARKATEAFTEDAAARVKEYPLASVGAAAAAGIAIGGLLGFGFAYAAFRRPRG